MCYLHPPMIKFYNTSNVYKLTLQNVYRSFEFYRMCAAENELRVTVVYKYLITSLCFANILRESGIWSRGLGYIEFFVSWVNGAISSHSLGFAMVSWKAAVFRGTIVNFGGGVASFVCGTGGLVCPGWRDVVIPISFNEMSPCQCYMP